MSSEPADRDERLAGVLERLIDQMQSGKGADIDRAMSEHPDLADELRELWGAVIAADVAADVATGAATEDTGEWPQSVAMPAVPLASGPPRRFGNYELLEELGRGGMGVVYRARQINPPREVAVKMILDGRLSSQADHARFQAEAEAAAKLDHPNIVPIYEVGQHQQRPFFSMKLVDGQTLGQLLSEGPISPREAAGLLSAVAKAIHYAHTRGVLHRDLKPSNLLIDQSGVVHITDFGLAKQFSGQASLTRSGAIVGTPSYMAPEQAAGNRGELGPKSDVYSLGCVLYQMLTGRPPFQAATAVDTLLLVLEQDPLPPYLLDATIDRDLEMIALKCLQKPPELRYTTADDLARDLDAFLADEPISARSGKFSQIVARMFRQSHHAEVLENWGVLWMWHSVVLLVLCMTTNWFQWQQDVWPLMKTPIPYLLFWGGGLAVWAPIFWALRRRAGPVTFVERQIAHVWGGSVIASTMLFWIEYLLGLPVLTLSPVLGLINGMAFIVKAGILSGEFYVHAAAMFATGTLMAVLAHQDIPHGYPIGISIFGIASALTFFVPGLKYYRQRVGGR